ncbi:MAG TPA: LysR family transcriptional regulator [Solirubrobacteraceae bacterium]|nr:LysR family transcriptional regulator [Solirubrobacteraceae bacterium]
MDVRELRYFVALAEERHFGRAAERLYIAQSGLSRAIRRVEDELGLPLFSRTPRRVELTDAGTTLLERAYGVLSDFEEVQAVADAVRLGHLGTLSLASSPAARYAGLSDLLNAFEESFPDVRVVRREELGPTIVEELLGGALDVGIACGAPARAGLRRATLQELELHLLLPADDRAAIAGGRMTLAALGARPVLLDAELADGDWQRLPTPLRRSIERPGSAAVDYDEGLRRVLAGGGGLLSARTFLGAAPRGIAIVELDPPVPVALELLYAAQPPEPVLARFLDLAGADVAGEDVSDSRR